MVLYKDQGVCAMFDYQDETRQRLKRDDLNSLSSHSFTNEVFSGGQAELHLRLQGQLFNDDTETIGVWKIVEGTDNVAIAILYRVQDIEKLMPPFVD